jgi:hypothetical protein
MIRTIFALFAGIFVGGCVATAIEVPSMMLHPLPAKTEASDLAAFRAHVASAPLAALLFVAAAWCAAPLAAAFVAGAIARRHFLFLGLAVAAVFFAMDMMNITAFPHPGWLIALGIVAPVIFGILGAHLASRLFGPSTSGPQPYDMRQKNMAC